MIKDANETVVATVTPSTTSPYSKCLLLSGNLVQVGSAHLTLTSITKGNTYSLTVITTRGISFTSPIVVAQ